MSHWILPAAGPDQRYVELSVFAGGFITLPENSFVFPSDADTKRSVPSMAFLVTHPGLGSIDREDHKPIRFMFDLGLRSDPAKYTGKQQSHLENRIPYSLGPSIASQLSGGGLDAARDIHIIILSHVHYDHHGDPEDFHNAKFVVGSGSRDLLQSGIVGSGSHQAFQSDLLPWDRTLELPNASDRETPVLIHLAGTAVESRWTSRKPFPSMLDLVGDGSIYIIDSPGHLPGHINLLCRVSPDSWVYLGGDSCHDTRLLTGEKEVSTWKDEDGNVMCIHLDRAAAEEIMKRIHQLRETPDYKVEVIMAHDWSWYEKNKEFCFPKSFSHNPTSF